jgi:N-acetylneuraminic acid mutarotase
VIGGFASGMWTPVNSNYEYDPKNKQWMGKSPMRTKRGAHASVVIDGKIYVVGGANRKRFNLVNTSALEVYDPIKDVWKKLTPIPTPRDNLTASSFGKNFMR